MHEVAQRPGERRSLEVITNEEEKGLLGSLTRRLIRTEWSLGLMTGSCRYVHTSLWEVIALVGSHFKPFSTVLFLGIHNYGPQHLDDAVAFLSRTCSKYPYEELISPPYTLADFFTALQVAQKQAYYRVCVEPWSLMNWWIVTTCSCARKINKFELKEALARGR